MRNKIDNVNHKIVPRKGDQPVRQADADDALELVHSVMHA